MDWTGVFLFTALVVVVLALMATVIGWLIAIPAALWIGVVVLWVLKGQQE